MSKFLIKCTWLPDKASSSELDRTLCRLSLAVGDNVVTEYRSADRTTYEDLQLPSYFLAEWVAENWWPLLWEPRKNEDSEDDIDFLDRHCILAAQHGFVLPKVTIAPFGRNIKVYASPRFSQLADVRFTKGGQIILPRQKIESELRKFVHDVVDHLDKGHIQSTVLQDTWSLIEETADNEVEFCRLMGALGVSPYIADPQLEKLLEMALAKFNSRLPMDLCLACTPDDFASASNIAQSAVASSASLPTSTLAPLSTIQLPPDSISLPAWRRGVNAARRLRDKIGIAELDPKGGDRLFDVLKLDPSIKVGTGSNQSTEGIKVVGVVERSAFDVKIALLQDHFTQRRFAAARAVFAAWSSESPEESRFLTPAVTRDQQASRAFAAEMMAPLGFIRSKMKGAKIQQDRVFEIANELNIGSDVVLKQALNNGLQVMPY